MLDLQEIANTIETLENSSTTFDTCMKLAALYTVQEHFSMPGQKVVERLDSVITESPEQSVVNELSDVLPAYGRYVSVKRRYQLRAGSEEELVAATKSVCSEISEFLTTLYTTTELPQCRIILVETLTKCLERMSKDGQIPM